MLPLPSISDVIASSTAPAATVFTAFYPVVFFILGIIIGVLVVGLVIRAFGRAVKTVTKRRR